MKGAVVMVALLCVALTRLHAKAERSSSGRALKAPLRDARAEATEVHILASGSADGSARKLKWGHIRRLLYGGVSSSKGASLGTCYCYGGGCSNCDDDDDDDDGTVFVDDDDDDDGGGISNSSFDVDSDGGDVIINEYQHHTPSTLLTFLASSVLLLALIA